MQSIQDLQKVDMSCIKKNIMEEITKKYSNLKNAIIKKKLYFRVSITTDCNLGCGYCHNEGQGKHNKCNLSTEFIKKCLRTANEIGFTRVQFTGGEPLLRSDISIIIEEARKIFSDVGITTNGVLLFERMDSLIMSGITRLHVSLTSQAFENKDGTWLIPEWLHKVLLRFSKSNVTLRLNLPLQLSELKQAKKFLPLLHKLSCDVRVFSIIPNKNMSMGDPTEKLLEMVAKVNINAEKNNLKGRSFVREYFEPNGLRCKSCREFDSCKEASRSLRLGADQILRPCLASRMWDLKCQEEDGMHESILSSTILALDY